MNVLVPGGMGYIGSHTVVELIGKGYTPVILDNLSNSSEEALNRIEKITGVRPAFYLGDVRDESLLDKVFTENKIDAVINFAGLKAVGESCRMPLTYYDNNLNGTIRLLQKMQEYGVKTIVFSSSATVYGDPESLPLTETSKTGGTTNPYGTTKYFLEQILTDAWKADNSLNVIILRYFNPVGAHSSGLIGEDPKGIPNNLMPFVAQVASGKLKQINIFGNDYPTPDGTGVRDYIHVVDLALGHICAIEKCTESGVHIYNLGTGHGYSVLDMVHAFEKACGKTLPYEIKERRPGDIAACYACPDKAREELGWEAKFNLEDMCRDQWNWQKNNPNGYNN